jgi:hypothetical protein
MMDYTSIKWIIFVALLLTVPAILFMIQVVFFIPAVFFLAGMFWSVTKLWSGNVGETAIFIAFFGIHLLVFGSLYYGIAVLLAKGVSAMASSAVRAAIVVMLVFGLGILTQLPIYGGGGHQPMKWKPLSAAIQPDYGPAAIPLVYIPILTVLVALLIRRRRHVRKMA